MFALILALVLSKANAQSFDFYEPKSAVQAPVVVFVHGGAWVSRSKASYRSLGEALAQQGYCTAVVDYELAPQAKHPQQVDQLEMALQSLAKKKSKVCQMDQWFLVGHSAGAHMISFWNSKYSNKRVKGFVGIEGIYDIPKLVQRWPDYQDQFIQSEFGAEDKWAAASPARLKMQSKAPWLVIQSGRDELVEMGQSTAFVDHLKAEKTPVELKVLKVLSHFGAVDSLGDPQSGAAKALRAFTDKAK